MLTIISKLRYAKSTFSQSRRKMRSLANANMDKFAITMGNRVLIVRERFEDYIKALMDGEDDE